MSSQQALRVVIVAMLATAGCGAPVCSSLRPTIEADDVPIGEPGFSIRVVAARPDQQWVVFSQVMEDTNGDGQLIASEYSDPGDASEIFFVRGVGPAERIDAFLGATDDTVGFVRDGVLEVVNVQTGVRSSLGDAPPLTMDGYSGSFSGVPDDAHLMRDGLLYLPIANRRGVALIDTVRGTRRVVPSQGWVHSLWVTNDWLLVESLVEAPTDPSNDIQRPYWWSAAVGRSPGFCHGLHFCDGPARTFQLLNLRSPTNEPFFLNVLNNEAGGSNDWVAIRPWGLVVERANGSSLVHPDGTEQPFPCSSAFVGIDTPMVVAHCPEEVPDAMLYGPRFVVQLGVSQTLPLDERALAAFAERDRSLLSHSQAQQANALIDASASGEARIFVPRVFPVTSLRWNERTRAWLPVARPRDTQGALAVSPDGSALLRRWPLDLQGCRSMHPEQLVWVQLNERWRRELPVFDYRNRDDLSQ